MYILVNVWKDWQLCHFQVYALDAPEELGGKEKRIADLVIGILCIIGNMVLLLTLRVK